MSGKNATVLDLPPGIVSNGTPYSVGQRWYVGNQVRWYKNLLSPVGGWNKVHTFSTATQPIRDMFSWRDYLKAPWAAAGSADKLFSLQVLGSSTYTVRDITPAGLVWSVPVTSGYGAGPYGGGPYGYSANLTGLDSTGLWSMDNFGRLLVAVHSQDGRLFSYDPTTPATIAAPVAGAPVNNTIVIATEEEHLMLLGGDGKPRDVAWCSQRDITDWTSTETNSAGGFELQSDGSIIAAMRVQGGILVLTDTDAHMIEYLGAPLYYGRRRISDEISCLGKNVTTTYGNTTMWMGRGNFWQYNGNIVQVPCDLHDDVFYNSTLTLPSRMFMFTNEFAQEVWLSYPGSGEVEPDRYVLMNFTDAPHWSMGDIPRTAWLNPCWTDRPLACNNTDLYEHEISYLADGVSRNDVIYAETGAIEIGEGDRVMRLDRIWPDFANVIAPSGQTEADLGAANITLKLRQSPNGSERAYGPVNLDTDKGYTVIRARGRQMQIRVSQQENEFWVMGKVRIRMKEGGYR